MLLRLSSWGLTSRGRDWLSVYTVIKTSVLPSDSQKTSSRGGAAERHVPGALNDSGLARLHSDFADIRVKIRKRNGHFFPPVKSFTCCHGARCRDGIGWMANNGNKLRIVTFYPCLRSRLCLLGQKRWITEALTLETPSTNVLDRKLHWVKKKKKKT